MPPGVSSSDIPGNRPEDEIADKICDECEYLIDGECPCDYDHALCPNDIDGRIEEAMCGNPDDEYDRLREMED